MRSLRALAREYGFNYYAMWRWKEVGQVIGGKRYLLRVTRLGGNRLYSSRAWIEAYVACVDRALQEVRRHGC